MLRLFIEKHFLKMPLDVTCKYSMTSQNITERAVSWVWKEFYLQYLNKYDVVDFIKICVYFKNKGKSMKIFGEMS